MRTAPPLVTVALLTVAPLIAGCHGGDAPPPQTQAQSTVSQPPASPASPVDRSTANAAPPAFPTNTTALPAQSIAAQQSTTATPATRPLATTAVTIKSASASIDAVLAGHKTSTTRKGNRAYPLGPAVLTDGKRSVAVTLTSVVTKAYADLTADDATTNGSATLAAMRASLGHDYPGLKDDDAVTVVRFTLASH